MFMFFGVFYTVLFEFGKKLDIVATPQHIFGRYHCHAGHRRHSLINICQLVVCRQLVRANYCDAHFVGGRLERFAHHSHVAASD